MQILTVLLTKSVRLGQSFPVGLKYSVGFVGSVKASGTAPGLTLSGPERRDLVF